MALYFKNIKYCIRKILFFFEYNKVTTKGKVTFYKTTKIKNFQNNKQNILINNMSHIRGELQVFSYGGIVKIGERCFIGEYSRIWSSNTVIIGNDVLISHNVNIIDTNTHEIDFQERSKGFLEMINYGHPNVKPNVDDAPIVISDNVWINFNCVILKGVTIGTGAIIAAGSIVTKNVPPFALVAGNPAKVIKFLK